MGMIQRMRLLSAVRAGKTEQVRKLLRAGADPESRNGDGRTALMLAAASGHRPVVYTLMLFGADVNARSDLKLGRGELALDRTALMVASGIWSLGLPEVVAQLLGYGAKVNDVDGDGRSALAHAVEAGHADVVRELLEAGADAELADVHGRTPLGVARDHGDPRVLKLLLAASVSRQ